MTSTRATHASRGPGGGRGGPLRARSRGPRQADHERGSAPGLALYLDPTIVRLEDLIHDEEADAHPSVVPGGDGPLEPLEDPALIGRRDPDSVVLHGQRRDLAVRLERDADRLALAVLDRVVQQVRHDLIEARPVP